MLVPVVDASVAVDWVAPGAAKDLPAQQLLRRWVADETEVYCPRLLIEEVFNALLTGIRRNRWNGADADWAAVLAAKMPISVRDNERDRARAWELARRYDNWPVYDMVYVALAERLGTTLVTADDRLRKRLAHLNWVVAPDDA